MITNPRDCVPTFDPPDECPKCGGPVKYQKGDKECDVGECVFCDDCDWVASAEDYKGYRDEDDPCELMKPNR